MSASAAASRQKTILFLDVSSRTGWAFDDADGTRPRLGTYKVPTLGEDIGYPCSRFQRWLTAMVTTMRPEIIGFEAPLMIGGKNKEGKSFSNIATARLLFGLATVVEIVAHDHKIQCREVNVATVKKHFAGSGRAEKPQMIERCAELGWPAKDHNEADAAGGWAYVKSVLYPGWAAAATPMFTTGNRDRLFDRQEAEPRR